MNTKAAKRARKSKDSNGAASLIAALKFVSLAQQKEGTPLQTHCVINEGRLMAFNGIFATGHLIEDDLSACPNTMKFLDALNKCGSNLSISQLDSGKLSIKSDKFKALIPCLPFEQLPAIEPDYPCAAIDDSLKTGFNLLIPLLNESAQHAWHAGALLQGYSVIGTNGSVLIEYWHGLALPNSLVIPKAALVAITKSDKKLSKFGFSSNSVTFFFEDESFIKSQLYNQPYPDYQAVLNVETNPWPLPEGFYEGLKKIESLSDNGRVYFNEAEIAVKDSEKNIAATYAIEGLKAGLCFNIEYLKILEPAFKTADFNSHSNRAFFFSENARGAIAGING